MASKKVDLPIKGISCTSCALGLAIKELKKMGIETAIIIGDNRSTTEAAMAFSSTPNQLGLRSQRHTLRE